jgi:hypothetical protein
MMHVLYEAATGRDRTFRDAAGSGDLAQVESLLQGGQSVESMSKYGATALHKAAGAGHLPVVQLLVDRGATVDKIHKGGQTPFDEAESRGFAEVADYLKGLMTPKEGPRERQLAVVGKELFQEATGQDAMRESSSASYSAWLAVLCRLVKVGRSYGAKDIGLVKYNIQKLTTDHDWFLDHINAMDLPALIMSCKNIDEVNRQVRNRLTRAMPAAAPSDDGTVQVFLPGSEGAMATYIASETSPLFSRFVFHAAFDDPSCVLPYSCTVLLYTRLEYYAGVKMPNLVKAGPALVAFVELRSPVGDKPPKELGNNDDRADTDIAWKVRLHHPVGLRTSPAPAPSFLSLFPLPLPLPLSAPAPSFLSRSRSRSRSLFPLPLSSPKALPCLSSLKALSPPPLSLLPLLS